MFDGDMVDGSSLLCWGPVGFVWLVGWEVVVWLLRSMPTSWPGDTLKERKC
ncbi:hypothetical protein [Companilactobacillus furfuricola]|uniref:hypothetical protein n=1 Tax=Companilactobacillus furfuricola TaxID=1462575 RepID=UPI0013DE7119|nr:hypothetical protein [Companilactobacillus furfuricola]